jgi:CRISPR-associated protein Csm2
MTSEYRINESNYVDVAEANIKKLIQENTRTLPNGKKSTNIVSTSKIRGLLSMVSDIYNDVLHETGETLSSDIVSRISYMKVHFYYEAGREKRVKSFLETAEVFSVINEIKGKRSGFILFSRYMEALVAFRKFYVEKDD